MIQKFVVRLLTAEGDLLSWAEVYAQARPQGRPRSTPFLAQSPTTFAVERDGLASQMSVHWCDLDVARVFPLESPTPVQLGQILRYDWFTMPVWMVEGSKVDVPLPAVTVRASVKVAPPPAAMGAASPA